MIEYQVGDILKIDGRSTRVLDVQPHGDGWTLTLEPIWTDDDQE